MDNTEPTFWTKVRWAAGFQHDKPRAVETRSELPVMDSTYLPRNPVNLMTYNDNAISPDRALGLAGVFRAVTIISNSVSQLPVGVWRNGEELEVRSSDLVSKPNYDISRAAFFEQTATSLAVNGNAFWKLTRQSPTAAVTNIEVLNPHEVYLETDADTGKLTYKYNGKTFQKWQIKHLWLHRFPGFPRGLGPIQTAQNELRGAIDLRNYSDNWFRDGGVPNGILKTDQVLTADQADAYKTRWDAQQATRGTAVIGQGISYQPVYLSPADAQFLESQAFSITQIARMFGIPAIKMMVDPGNSMTYANIEQVDTAFVRETLMKYLLEIETALSELLPRGQEVKFKVEVLLRADTLTRYQAYELALNAQWMTRNEVRKAEGLPPLANGNAIAPVENTEEQGEPV